MRATAGASPRVRLLRAGVTAEGGARTAELYTIAARVPELEASFPRGLPRITRQRLQWGTSTVRATAASVRGDLWLYNHLAGGPVLEALGVAGHAQAASAFSECKHNSASLKRKCFNSTIEVRNASLLPWSTILDETLGGPTAPARTGHIDLLVVDVRDPTVGELLRAFPLERSKPSLIYFRTSGSGHVRKHLLAHGYQLSAHAETSSWGEHTLAWRADRCDNPGMPQRPAWWIHNRTLREVRLGRRPGRTRRRASAGRRLRRDA